MSVLLLVDIDIFSFYSLRFCPAGNILSHDDCIIFQKTCCQIKNEQLSPGAVGQAVFVDGVITDAVLKHVFRDLFKDAV